MYGVGVPETLVEVGGSDAGNAWVEFAVGGSDVGNAWVEFAVNGSDAGKRLALRYVFDRRFTASYLYFGFRRRRFITTWLYLVLPGLSTQAFL